MVMGKLASSYPIGEQLDDGRMGDRRFLEP